MCFIDYQGRRGWRGAQLRRRRFTADVNVYGFLAEELFQNPELGAIQAERDNRKRVQQRVDRVFSTRPKLIEIIADQFA